MRDILFKAKRIDNGDWAVSNSLLTFECHPITHDKVVRLWCVGEGWIWVNPNTVGQYTGFTVPSGKIFEHDIVTAKFKSNGERHNFTVKYSKADGCYVFDNGSVKVPFRSIRSVRIIGNIHDNPELLKG